MGRSKACWVTAKTVGPTLDTVRLHQGSGTTAVWEATSNLGELSMRMVLLSMSVGVALPHLAGL
jgi:hypothetical protein